MRHNLPSAPLQNQSVCDLCAGELPLAIGRLKANGCEVNLYGNKALHAARGHGCVL